MPAPSREATKPWQMWALTAPGVVVHRIREDKSAATFTSLVGDYRGVIVADALSTHEAGASTRQPTFSKLRSSPSAKRAQELLLPWQFASRSK